MKRIAKLICALFIGTSMLTSCLNDSKPSTATINYIGMPDSIKFTDTNDTVWKDNIYEALAKMEVLAHVMEVSDTSQTSYQSYVIEMCNYKAGGVYDKMLKKVTLSDVKKNIYNAHADSLVKLGYNSGAESLPIDAFTLHSSLWSLYTGTKVFYYNTIVK